MSDCRLEEERSQSALPRGRAIRPGPGSGDASLRKAESRLQMGRRRSSLRCAAGAARQGRPWVKSCVHEGVGQLLARCRALGPFGPHAPVYGRDTTGRLTGSACRKARSLAKRQVRQRFARLPDATVSVMCLDLKTPNAPNGFSFTATSTVDFVKMKCPSRKLVKNKLTNRSSLVRGRRSGSPSASATDNPYIPGVR